MRRLQVGDVLEVQLPEGGFSFVLYVGVHRTYGECILVPPHPFDRHPGLWIGVFADAYPAFYPASVAVREKLATVVGSTVTPRGMPPTRLRRPIRGEDRCIEAWVIEDASGESVRSSLSEVERALPIASIWSHGLLVDRIAGGWRPEMADVGEECADSAEGTAPGGGAFTEELVALGNPATDAGALAALSRHVNLADKLPVQHYLYFPRRGRARGVARTLSEEGYDVKWGRAAMGRVWLVLARHKVVPSEDVIDNLRQRMEALAAESGGEYDGWEAEVAPT